MFKEFREFALKGNMIDMAVGIVIGAAFTTVVNSIVTDLFTPLLGLIGGKDFSNYFVVLKRGGSSLSVTDVINNPYNTLAEAKSAGAVTLNYGLFLNAMISFLIVSFALFMFVKFINHLKRQQAASNAPAIVPPPKEEVLLTEIRDILKQNRIS